MKFIFSVAAILLFLSANSQDSTSGRGHLKITYVPGDKAKRDSIIPQGPNELYFNIGPSLSLLQGAHPTNEINLTFMYKRTVKNSRLAYRMGIAYKADVRMRSGVYGNQFIDYNSASANSEYFYFDQTDSSRTMNFLDDRPFKKFQFNLGLEKRSKGKGRWSGFVGMDLVFGFYNHSCTLYNVRQVKDPNGNWGMENSDTSIVMLDFKKAGSYYFGVSPKAGLSYAFNRRWLISVQAAVLATFDSDSYFTRNSTFDKINQQKSETFDFGFNGILDELNLVYRF